MKDVREWDEDYVLNLPLGEHDWIEFKGRKACDLSIPNVDGNHAMGILSKAISAFANSGGGYLVLGVSDPSTGQRTVDDGGISRYIKRPNTREWLEDIIPGLVDFPLQNFNVYEIVGLDATSQIGPNQAIYIIEIPDSAQSPHQANDHLYYARVGGKSRPINHRLVSDIFGRRQNPEFELEFLVIKFSSGNNFYLRVVARNVGRVYAQYVNAFFHIPSCIISAENQQNWKDHYKETIEGVEYFTIIKKNTHRDSTGLSTIGPIRFEPILPGLYEIWDITSLVEEFSSKVQHMPDDLTIKWEIFVDNSSMKEGSILVKDITVNDQTQEKDNANQAN